jgi:hypothetical protein
LSSIEDGIYLLGSVRTLSREITLIIKTRECQLLWTDFREAIQENILALGDVGAGLADRDKLTGSWRIDSLSMQSPATVHLRYETDEEQEIPEDWMETYVNGMAILEGSEEQPRDFPETALRHIAKLTRLSDRVESIEYLIPGEEKVVTSLKAPAHASVVREDIRSKRPAHYYSYGELRGVLGQITIHESTSEFAIYDPATKQRIHCKFSPEHASEVAELLTKRVAVFGRIAYNRKDRPTSVDVESWKPLKEQDELASLEAIRRAMKPLPDGMSSEDYVRGQRDGD